MIAPASAHVFISYSRKDGAEAAAELRRWLEDKGFAIWQDLVALEGGRDWWSQIEAALKSKALHHFILIVTPGALASPIVRREIRLARQEGKTFLPVKGPALGDLAELPRWLGQIVDIDLPEHRTSLLRTLEADSKAPRVPMMAPEPPVDFVARPLVLDALKRQLIDAKGDAVPATVALRGAGGYGKTALARALAHDPDILDAYFDGVLWVELGERATNLLSILSDLIALIDGERRAFDTLNAAVTGLGEAFGDRRMLLVIDDAWRAADLRPLLQGGRNVSRLITTRLDRILPADAVQEPVNAMTADEAFALLSWGLPVAEVSAQAGALRALVERLGAWAQLLKLANGVLGFRLHRAREPLERAIAYANRRLDEKGLTAFDVVGDGDRSTAVARTIGVSLDLLDTEQRARFAELAVFPEDTDVPIGIVAQLWHVDRTDAEHLLGELLGLSLLLNLDLDWQTLRLHNTTRYFLEGEAKRENALAALHQRLAHAMAGIRNKADAHAAEAEYLYRFLPHHLAAAGDRSGLDALLLDPAWLRDKLAATGSPQALVGDYEQHAQGQMQSLIGRTLRLTTGICTRDPRQLLPQLFGRLMACPDPATEFAARTRAMIRRPALLPMLASLTPPGAEIMRLEGHTTRVTAIAVLPDGRIASGSDYEILLWDLATGTETTRLEGHYNRVTGLVVLPDGRLASSSYDRTVRLWDLASGTQTARFGLQAPDDDLAKSFPWLLKGDFTRWVTALAVLPDGRLASGWADGTVRLLDPATGAEIGRFDGHVGLINALAVLPDGHLASGGDERLQLWGLHTGEKTAGSHGRGTLVDTVRITALAALPDGRFASGGDEHIRLYDPVTGDWTVDLDETAELEGPRMVTALAVLPDGRLASGSENDKVVRLWDLAVGDETARLEGHTKPVLSLAVLPDGRLASGSNDGTVRLWDLTTRAETARQGGHTERVTALAVLPDGRVASADGTVRLWDPATGIEIARLKGRVGSISALAVLPDGRLASGLGAVRVWDPATGAEIACLDVPPDWGVTALAALPDGRLATILDRRHLRFSDGWKDMAVRLWDLATGVMTARLKEPTGRISALVALADGRLALGSEDRTVRFWDPATGAETACLKGHVGCLTALAVLPDGRLVSGADDWTIHIWDPATGAETARLDHGPWGVTSLAVLPNGRLVSGSKDKTVRLWDPSTGTEIARLEVDAPVNCLATLPDGRIIAGDELGRLHWLEIMV
jgi:WD40 repeat protein